VRGSGGFGPVTSCGGPSVGGRAHAEGGEAGDVVGGSEESEVGVDLGFASHPGAAAAVFAAHQVGEFAFDLGAVGPVVGSPGRIGLALSGPGEDVFVAVHLDLAARSAGGALAVQRAGAAGVTEVGDAAAVSVAVDGRGDFARAGDRVALEIDLEPALGEDPAGRRR